jgi:sortase A
VAWIVPPARKSPAWRWLPRFFLVLGFALLGYVAYALVDARVFQAYETWRLEHTPRSAPAAAVTPAAALSPVSLPVVAPRKIAPLGAMLGRIQIHRIGVDAIIVEGTDGRSLGRAVGHIAGTALLDERGNVGLAGHRDTFFRPLRDIRPDDEIIVTTLAGRYRYKVESTRVVTGEDISVLEDPGQSILTLVTCYPFYYVGHAPERFIVRARRE